MSESEHVLHNICNILQKKKYEGDSENTTLACELKKYYQLTSDTNTLCNRRLIKDTMEKLLSSNLEEHKKVKKKRKIKRKTNRK